MGNDPFCEVTFDDVKVPSANLVGVEGNAFGQTMRQLEQERGGIDRLVSNRALFLQASALVSNDPALRQELGRLEGDYRIGRLLVLREALGQAPPGFSAATKCFCTEYEQRVSEFAFRVFGVTATLWTDLVRGLCYAPAYTIMGGTSNVLRNIISERLLGLPRSSR